MFKFSQINFPCIVYFHQNFWLIRIFCPPTKPVRFTVEAIFRFRIPLLLYRKVRVSDAICRKWKQNVDSDDLWWQDYVFLLRSFLFFQIPDVHYFLNRRSFFVKFIIFRESLLSVLPWFIAKDYITNGIAMEQILIFFFLKNRFTGTFQDFYVHLWMPWEKTK